MINTLQQQNKASALTAPLPLTLQRANLSYSINRRCRGACFIQGRCARAKGELRKRYFRIFELWKQ